MISCGLLLFELAVAFVVENYLTAILLNLSDQGLFVDMNSAFVRLVDLLDFHEVEHPTNSFPHSIVPMTNTTHSCLAITSDNIN